MKCKVCGSVVTNQQVKDEIAIKITYNVKNLYFCSQECCKKYFDNEKVKKKNTEMLNKIDEFIKGELNYFSKVPKLPSSLYTRINDLHNGTKRTGNREIKNGTGDGYSYEVIYETIVKYKDTINYFLDNKLSDAKESQKVNYLMAIIEGNINDVYTEHIRKTKCNTNPTFEHIDYAVTKEKNVQSNQQLFDENDLL